MQTTKRPPSLSPKQDIARHVGVLAFIFISMWIYQVPEPYSIIIASEIFQPRLRIMAHLAKAVDRSAQEDPQRVRVLSWRTSVYDFIKHIDAIEMRIAVVGHSQ